MGELHYNLGMNQQRARRATAAATEAKRQKNLKPFELGEPEGHDLTEFEQACDAGHAEYMRMIEEGIIGNTDQSSRSMRISRQNRGALKENTNIKVALAEFEETGGSMYVFCQSNYRRFKYRSFAAMYTAFRHRRLTALD